MKKLLIILSIAILGCTLPVQLNLEGANTPTPTATVVIPTQTFAPTPELGSEKNPLIFAIAPSAQANPETVAIGEEIAAFLESRTGYRVVTIAPASESNLVDAFNRGNAHIAMLSPFGYLQTREHNSTTAILASTRNGQMFYGAQFLANRESEFIPFFDIPRNENTAEFEQALLQFKDKKPCWSDAYSPSGYIVPLGILNQAGIPIQEGAFLEGQANVVRAIYAGDICNFGATYIDARELPLLEANYPDVFERVKIIWRIPAVIPYENISMSNALPIEIRRSVQRAFIDLMLTDEGKAKVQAVYGIDALQAADDTMYQDFAEYVKASGVKLDALIQK